MQISFRSRAEAEPGAAWRGIFALGWPGWRDWYLSHGGAEAPPLDAARRALVRHMPELVGLWEKLVETVGGDEDAARFLSFWTPPRYLAFCSQAVLVDQDGPMLVRNYDLDPKLSEATLLLSRWKRRAVLGMVDGLSGLADGMNDQGLALSLAFGGRAITGSGFGVPWILRYVLEICTETSEAVEVLRRVPCHMSYNVTMLDRHGRHATLMLAPDRPAIVTDQRAATNHQLGVEWPRQGRISRTLERAEHLDRLLTGTPPSRAALHDAFLSPPLLSTAYAEGFGTVYTARYLPAERRMALSWPGQAERHFSFDAFLPADWPVTYSDCGI